LVTECSLTFDPKVNFFSPGQVFWLVLVSEVFPFLEWNSDEENRETACELTAAGTAPVSNRVPFSTSPKNIGESTTGVLQK
jgi:hypothetical protein